jgi:hypothetical protein
MLRRHSWAVCVAVGEEDTPERPHGCFFFPFSPPLFFWPGRHVLILISLFVPFSTAIVECMQAACTAPDLQCPADIPVLHSTHESSAMWACAAVAALTLQASSVHGRTIGSQQTVSELSIHGQPFFFLFFLLTLSNLSVAACTHSACTQRLHAGSPVCQWSAWSGSKRGIPVWCVICSNS